MRTGWDVTSPDLEPHGRALDPAVVGPVLARDPVRLPVVAAGAVEPELGEVEELRPVLVAPALLLAGAPDRLVAADDALGILGPGLAYVDPDLPGARHVHLERRALSGRHAVALLGRYGRDATGGVCGRGEEGECGHGRRNDESAHGAAKPIPSSAGMRVAVVDIGTNSTRLLIADVEPGAGVAERHRESIVTRLGEGVDVTGRLGEEPQARVFAALERYAAEIAAHGCEASTAVMTSAVRDAANGGAFAALVRERHGLAGRTLSGDEEAGFTFAGATAARAPDDPRELVVIDIGGGSTELVCGARGELGFHVSTQIGVVRHTERHLRGDPPTEAELAALAAAIDAGVAAAVPEDVRARTQAAIAVAGTATSCAAIDLALEVYDTAKVEGHMLSHERLEALLARLA